MKFHSKPVKEVIIASHIYWLYDYICDKSKLSSFIQEEIDISEISGAKEFYFSSLWGKKNITKILLRKKDWFL